jgi:hypothetical protein
MVEVASTPKNGNYVPFSDITPVKQYSSPSPTHSIQSPISHIEQQSKKNIRHKKSYASRGSANSFSSLTSSTASIGALAADLCEADNDEQGANNYISRVRVQSAREHSRKNGAAKENFIVYSVSVQPEQGPSFQVFRRYNQFHTFHQQLQQKYPNLPKLPPKTMLSSANKMVIKRRVLALDKYLGELLAIPGLREDLAFISFLGATTMMTTHATPKNQLTEFSWSHRSGAVRDHSAPIYDMSRKAARSEAESPTAGCFSCLFAR